MARLLPTSATLPPLVLAFHALLSSLLASPAIIARAHLLRDGVPLSDDSPGVLSSDWCTVDIAQLVGSIFLENHVHPVQEMSGAGTDGLRVMLAPVHHLIVIDDGNLGIELAGDVGIEKAVLLDQVGTSLGNVESFAFGITTLAAIGDQAVPAAKVTGIGKTSGATDETSVDRTSLFANTEKGLDVSTGMQLKIGRMDSATPHGIRTLFEVGQLTLLPRDFRLE